MGRRPKIKVCADPACPATFTGRGLYCAFHRAGRDPATTSAIKFRKERKAESKRRRRRAEWDSRWVATPRPEYTDSGVATPLHKAAGHGVAKLGYSRPGPVPIDVTRTPGMTAFRAIRIFMIEWRAWQEAAP